MARTYSYLLAATRRLHGVVCSCSEFLGATLSLLVAPPPLVTGTYSYLLGAARSCSEFLGATLSLPVAPPTGTYSYLLGAARSYSEFIGVPRSNSLVASCFPLVTGTYSYLLGAARSCSKTTQFPFSSFSNTFRCRNLGCFPP